MAKKAVKTATKSVKQAVARTKAKPNASDLIEKACEAALTKLKSLKLSPDLQADIEWCLGSYRHDKNPAGLFEMGAKALLILSKAAEKNSKSVSKKLISDLDKALASR